jgi:hypothetical protein
MSGHWQGADVYHFAARQNDDTAYQNAARVCAAASRARSISAASAGRLVRASASCAVAVASLRRQKTQIVWRALGLSPEIRRDGAIEQALPKGRVALCIGAFEFRPSDRGGER